LALVDKKGRLRDGLEDKIGLLLRDEKGTPRAHLTATIDGPMLLLHDERGTPRADLTANKDGPTLALSDKDGKPIWRAP
jgi:hypothetical protein